MWIFWPSQYPDLTSTDKRSTSQPKDMELPESLPKSLHLLLSAVWTWKLAISHCFRINEYSMTLKPGGCIKTFVWLCAAYNVLTTKSLTCETSARLKCMVIQRQWVQRFLLGETWVSITVSSLQFHATLCLGQQHLYLTNITDQLRKTKTSREWRPKLSSKH